MQDLRIEMNGQQIKLVSRTGFYKRNSEKEYGYNR
jgi:hypothetical protein